LDVAETLIHRYIKYAPMVLPSKVQGGSYWILSLINQLICPVPEKRLRFVARLSSIMTMCNLVLKW